MNENRYQNILIKIRSYKNGVMILNVVNRMTTTIVYLVYPIFLFLLAFYRDIRFWKTFLLPGISFIIVSLFRSYINFSRPYEVFDILPAISKDTKGKSFPSRHVFSVFVIAMTLYNISKPIGIILMCIGVVIALVRVVGGVHFPRDVIAGAVIGILFGML